MEVRHFEARALATRQYRAQLRTAIRSLVREVEARPLATLVSWTGGRGRMPKVQSSLVTIAESLGIAEAELIARWAWVDLREHWQRSLVSPAPSWTIRDVAAALGEPHEADVDGYLSGLMYRAYVRGGPEPDWSAMLGHAERTLRALSVINQACVAASRVSADSA